MRKLTLDGADALRAMTTTREPLRSRSAAAQRRATQAAMAHAVRALRSTSNTRRRPARSGASGGA